MNLQLISSEVLHLGKIAQMKKCKRATRSTARAGYSYFQQLVRLSTDRRRPSRSTQSPFEIHGGERQQAAQCYRRGINLEGWLTPENKNGTPKFISITKLISITLRELETNTAPLPQTILLAFTLAVGAVGRPLAFIAMRTKSPT